MAGKIQRIRTLIKLIFTREQLKSIIFLELIVGILYSIASFIFFIFLTNAVLEKQTIYFDNLISNYIFLYRNQILTPIMLFFSFSGSTGLVFASIIIVIFLTLRKHRKETFIFSILLLMGLIATYVLKFLFKVPRPIYSVLVHEKSYSFPSGHALNSFLFYGTVAYFIYHFTKNRKLSAVITVLCISMIMLIGLSRIYLGAHRPSDVLAGYTFGFWLFVVTIMIDKTVSFLRIIRESEKNS